MRVVVEAVQEVLERLMHHRVMRDFVVERGELGVRRQLAVDQEVRDFEKARILRELLDRVTAIEQHAGVAIDERDRASHRSRRHEARIEREVARFLVELADVEGRIAERSAHDRQRRRLVRGGIDDLDGFVGHGADSLAAPALRRRGRGFRAAGRLAGTVETPRQAPNYCIAQMVRAAALIKPATSRTAKNKRRREAGVR